MTGFFVTGTDTEVGKTVVCAWLMRALDGEYWKPVQCGLTDVGGKEQGEPGGDCETVQRLTGFSSERFHPPAHVFSAPRSPHEAAEMDGAAIAMDDFTLPVTTRPLIVEGAGGVLVPLNDQATMCDLMVRLSLPVILVARTALGTINHSLLSIEALRARGIDLAGIVLCGPQDSANTAAIQAHGLVPVIGDLPRFESLTPQVLAAFADQHPPVLTKA
ncbi:MAG: dethiobiotin synthase [Rhodospirillaceae bacterium]|jgi:dethiobiotin synthase|nr:dethiobiotin synthase [Rhodospirillaceae bacterium]MBT5659057.1 dethiobiotin synthase [Rhodospirillaceae bacterium]MBT5752533.1 dethiobiotin synthase [Rhodospirillaceae bacterium]